MFSSALCHIGHFMMSVSQYTSETNQDWVPKWAEVRVGASSLVVFRVCFGLLLAAWCCDYLLHDRVRYMFVAPGFHFSYFGLEWVQPWPPVLMTGQSVLMGLAALGVAVGFCYRISSLVLAIGFSHFFLIDRTTYQNHYYLCCLLCWTMVLMSVSSKWSVDVLIRRIASCPTLPAWNLWAVRFHIALPYFFGGIAKLDSDWLTGNAVKSLFSFNPWPRGQVGASRDGLAFRPRVKRACFPGEKLLTALADGASHAVHVVVSQPVC